MDWRYTTLARWLGWTLAFALLFVSFLVPFVHPVLPDVANLLVLLCFVLSFVAAYWIGVRFPSPWWPAGPPVAVLAAVLVVLAVPESGPATPTAMGPMTGKDNFELLLIFGGWILLVLLALAYAALARAGVRNGKLRAAERRREVRR